MINYLIISKKFDINAFINFCFKAEITFIMYMTICFSSHFLILPKTFKYLNNCVSQLMTGLFEIYPCYW